MTAVCGVIADRPREHLEHIVRRSLDRLSLYADRPPRIATVEGAGFGAAIFPTTPEDLADVQPLTAGRCVLVADARIDNRTELIAALSEPGLTLSSPDSVLLLAGWQRWNCGLFDRISGAFAIAVFDEQERVVTLARGPAGDRPLCYRVDGAMLRFSSMPSGLLDDGFVPDLAALGRLIVKRDMKLGETCFDGIRAVLPGHFLQWSEGKIRTERFWRPLGVDPSLTDVTEQFRSLLDEAVRCRLRRLSGPVAAHLSSGFDSSSVTASAATMLKPKDLVAFTMKPAPGKRLLVPRARVADEVPFAEQVAQTLGIRHRVVSDASPLLDALRNHGRIFQAPVPNVPNHGWAQAIDAQAAAAGAKVLLSATQGNSNVSFGNIDLLSEWLRKGQFLEYFRQARALVRSGAARWRGAIFYSVDDFLPRPIRNRLAGDFREAASDLFIRNEWMQLTASESIGSDYTAPGLRSSQFAIYANTDLGLFTKGTLGKSGLDERDPTADSRLMEFCLRIPTKYYLDGGITKCLVRQGLSDRLPAFMFEPRPRGYQGADWFAKLDRNQALAWIEDIASSHFASEILNIAALRRAVSEWNSLGRMQPAALRQWGGRFTRALAVGAFLHEAERDLGSFGRKPRVA